MERTVRVASPLRSYTQGAASVTAEGDSVAALLDGLERRFPGMRFRMVDEQGGIRPHIRIYAGTHEVRALGEAMGAETTLHIICALSGG
jgi:molybdopterin converting factor small subunit